MGLLATTNRRVSASYSNRHLTVEAAVKTYVKNKSMSIG